MFAALMNLSDGRINWLTSNPEDGKAVRRKKSRMLAIAIKPLLEALVLDDMAFIQTHRVPIL